MSSKNYLDKNGLTYFWGKVQNEISPKANTSDVLTKTNTTSYTPSANYHPATKKYVDDKGFADLSDVFVITCSMDSNDNPVVDKTWNEIVAAVNAGKVVCLSEGLATLTYFQDTINGEEIVETGRAEFIRNDGYKTIIWDTTPTSGYHGYAWTTELNKDATYIHIHYYDGAYIFQEDDFDQLYNMIFDTVVVLVYNDHYYYLEEYGIRTDLNGRIIVFSNNTGVNYQRFVLFQPYDTSVSTTITYTSESLQPDWNENTSTDPSYVANRTHYLSDPTWQTIYSGTLTFDETTGNYWEHSISGYRDWTFLATNGTPYRITYGEDTYTGNLIFNQEYGAYLLGNLSIWFEEETDTGEPFIINFGWYTESIGFFLQLADESYHGTVEFNMSLYIPIVNKLDLVYLDGKTILRGAGRGAEIFNIESGYIQASLPNRARGDYSHCEGSDNSSSGNCSHCEGSYNESSGGYSHCEGSYNESSGYRSHCEGYYSRSVGECSHSEGYGAVGSIQINLTANANATKYDTFTTFNTGRHPKWLIGQSIEDTYITDIEYFGATVTSITVAKTLNPDSSISNNMYRIYNYSMAYGKGSHSEGFLNTSHGIASHSEGDKNVSFSDYSHTEGGSTIASSQYQHVQGKYNIEDASETYAHIVGNGSSNTSRSNAHTLDWDGNSWYAGKVSAGTVASPASVTNANDLTTKAYVDNALSGVTTNLAGLTDTTVSSPSNGQILIYNSTTSKWENVTSPYQTQAQVNALIAAALAEYGDGDTATYGYTDGNEVNY